MRPAVSYILYATSYNKKTDDMITFAQFEEGNLAEKMWCRRRWISFGPIDESSTTNDDCVDESISKIILRIFGTEVKYIQKLTQEMLDWKYVTVLNKKKMNGKEHNAQQRVLAKVYIKSLRLL